MNVNEIEQLNFDSEMPAMPDIPNMKVVPSRWEHSGWRYMFVEPSKDKFLNKPNRINGAFGIGDQDPRRGSFESSIIQRGGQRSSIADSSRMGPEQTSYHQAFNSGRESQDESSPYRQIP